VPVTEFKYCSHFHMVIWHTTPSRIPSMLKTHARGIIGVLGRLGNCTLFITQYLVFGWILPLVILPASLIHHIFDNDTCYWNFNYRMLWWVLRVEAHYLTESRWVDEGWLLSNHRTWADMFIDPLLSESTIVGRYMAAICVLPGSLLAQLDGRLIVFNRSSANQRMWLFDRCLSHSQKPRRYAKRILFYPEGRRMSHQQLRSVEESRAMLRPGLLRSIYEHKTLPVQLQISKNKERVMNERRFTIGCGTTIHVSFSEPIHPSRFDTFDAFYCEICRVWYEQFNATMSHVQSR
jgi:hypothetical protein